METIKEQLSREEQYVPALEEQIDNEPKSIMEQIDELIVLTKKLEKMAVENANTFREMLKNLWKTYSKNFGYISASEPKLTGTTATL